MRVAIADMAQVVEHVLGKDEVTSSNLVISIQLLLYTAFLFALRAQKGYLLCCAFLFGVLYFG